MFYYKPHDQQRKNLLNYQKNSISAHIHQVEYLKFKNFSQKDETMEEKKISQSINKSLFQKMSYLKDSAENQAQRLEDEFTRNINLEQEIYKYEKLINDHKKKTQSEKESKEMYKLMKEIKKYEYKLDQNKQKHNQALAEIKRLNEEVNLARRERVIFDNVFQKLETDLKLKEEELKKKIADYVIVENDKQQMLEELNNNKEITLQENQKYLQAYEHLFHGQNNESQNSEDQKFHQKPVNHEVQNRLSMMKSQKSQENINLAKKQQINEYIFNFFQEKLVVENQLSNIEEFFETYHKQEEINDNLKQEYQTKDEQNEQLKLDIIQLNDEIEDLTLEFKENKDGMVFQKYKKQNGDFIQKYLKNEKLKKENSSFEFKLNYIQKTVPIILDKLGYPYKDEEENEFNSEDVKNQCSHLNDLTMKLFGKQDRVLKKNILKKTFKIQLKETNDKRQTINEFIDTFEQQKDNSKILTKDEIKDCIIQDFVRFKEKLSKRKQSIS